MLEGQSSPTRSINSGVPQGSVFGPFLFLVYINDLPDVILSQLAMYADESPLYCVSPNCCNTSRGGVAASLNWLVTFNSKKT